MAEELTTCDGCGRETKTIVGRCPHCGYAKGAVIVPSPKRPSLTDGFWDTIGALLSTSHGMGMMICLALLIAGAILKSVT